MGVSGEITNGFGATPATGILTLPSENKILYSVKLFINPFAYDISQRALTKREQALSLGGIGIESGLVPELGTTIVAGEADTNGNKAVKIKYSISDAFEVMLFDYGSNHNVSQASRHARLYADNGSQNFRFGGKGVILSPLRGGPFWMSIGGSLGRNLSETNTLQGYAFGEVATTWQFSSKLALSANPKVAWSGAGNLYGLGIGANYAVAPKIEILPEIILAGNSLSKTTTTIGMRYQFSDSIASTIYATTASSLSNIGQLLGKGETAFGVKISIRVQ